MQTPVNYPIHDYQEKEIDLLELFSVIWENKKIVLITMIIFLVPVAIWLKIQPSIYNVEILIENTSSYNIQALQPTKLIDGERYQLNSLKPEQFYETFAIQASSLHTQKLFWENWSKQPLSKDPKTGNTANDLLFREFVDGFTLTLPDPKKLPATMSKIALATASPTDDLKLLTAYVEFLNKQIIGQFVIQLKKGYSSSLQQLQLDYDTLKMREQQKLEDKLLQLKESYDLARSLKIVETPYSQLAGIQLKVIDDRLYLLGTRALEEELKSFEERMNKPLGAFVIELRNMEYWKKTMENDVQKLSTTGLQARAFELSSPAVSSLEPVKPKRLLIFLAAAFLSAVFGVVIIFIMHGVKSYSERSVKHVNSGL